MLDKRYENPVQLMLSNTGNVMVVGEERLSLETGVMLGGEHYGFDVYLDNDVISHGTQCRIVGVQIVGDNLTILEDNKYIPWRLDKKTGEVINEAIFSFLKKTEIAFIKEHFCIETEEELNKINGKQQKM